MADMQTAMKEALSKAPSPLAIKTMSERVWLYLKDHPKTTAKRLSTELREPVSIISSTVSTLVRRKMLTFEVEAIRLKGGRGPKTHRRYSVEPKMGGRYELWPIVVKSKSRKATRVSAPAPQKPVQTLPPVHETGTVQQPPLTIKPQIVTIAKSQDFIDGLTVAEARALYERLHKMFGA
jgi:hypothetical protein